MKRGATAPAQRRAADYPRALERLYALESRGIRLGASRMQRALALRGHPERGGCFVLVGGTNGKGSVAAMIASCLSAAGYRTGLFTSPHLHRYVERVRIDGRPLAEREAAARIAALLAAFRARGAPETTFFELTTLLALEAFRDHRCEVAVLEVGLGGRLDATNAVAPRVSVITRIALDHTQVLGDSLAQIAREKAGILRPGIPAVIGVRDAEARRVIAARARRLGAGALYIDRDFEPQLAGAFGRRARLDVRVGERCFSDLRVPLAGEHQRDNVACAVAALAALSAAGLGGAEAAIGRGLGRVRWPGRLERIAGRPRFVLDAAHNADGCAALARYLDHGGHGGRGVGRRVLVFGAMADKPYPAMLRILAPRFDRIYYCPPPMRRAASYSALNRAARGARTRGLGDALARARRSAGPNGEVVVAGSIFLIAAARGRLLGVRSDPPIRM